MSVEASADRRGRSTLTSPEHRPMRRFAAIAGVSLLAVTIASAFLMPLAFMVATPSRTPACSGTPGAPLYPAVPETFAWEGTEYPSTTCHTDDGAVHAWALVEPHREDALFIDPANPEAGLIQWEGRWRTLTQHWNFQLQLRQLRDGVADARLPEDVLQHVRDRRAVHDRGGRLGDLRRVRLQPVPLPGSPGPVPADAGDDHPALPGHAGPHVCRVPGARLGRHLAAA